MCIYSIYKAVYFCHFVFFLAHIHCHHVGFVLLLLSFLFFFLFSLQKKEKKTREPLLVYFLVCLFVFVRFCFFCFCFFDASRNSGAATSAWCQSSHLAREHTLPHVGKRTLIQNELKKIKIKNIYKKYKHGKALTHQSQARLKSSQSGAGFTTE